MNRDRDRERERDHLQCQGEGVGLRPLAVPGTGSGRVGGTASANLRRIMRGR